MIPSREVCYELLEKYHMPAHIKAHSQVVAKIAGLIGHGLIQAGVALSPEKIAAGALLHDIAKGLCFDSAEDHALKGAEICRSHQMDEIALIVEKHIRLPGYEIEGGITEEEIVYYADKRVNHDVIVSLEERMEYLFERYAKDSAKLQGLIRNNFKLCKEVEDKLFAFLPFTPEEVALQLETELLL
jgi:putative nucleotidyltransferase with HDIG domain